MPRFFVPSGTGSLAAPGSEAAPARDATGPIVVDVGDGRGALVLTCDEQLWGCEVEIVRDDDESARTHVYVLPRAVAGGTIHAAVFPSLPAGGYVVFDLQGRPAHRLEVLAGRVTSARWYHEAPARREDPGERLSRPPRGARGHA